MKKGIKEITETAKYMGMIFKSAWATVAKETGIVKIVLGLLAAVLIFDCLIILAIVGSFPHWVMQLINDFGSEIRTGLTYFAFGTILLGMIFPFIYFHEAAKIHVRQENTIQKQKNQIYPRAKFELSPYHPEAGDNGVRWAGVYIQNKSGARSIKQCKVKLLSFIPEIRGVNNLPSDLMWSDNNRPDANGFLIIPRDGTVTLDIVVSYENYSGGTVTLRRGANVIIFSPGIYTIEFQIDGIIGNSDIVPQKFSANIVLELGKDIRLEEIKQHIQ